MKLTIDKNKIKEEFLLPISKVICDDESNKGCIIDINNDKIECVANTKDGSVILYATHDLKESVEESSVLNIYDLKKFIRLIDCIDNDNIKFTINSNNITYTSPTLKFKYHLMDDGVIKRSVVNINKINALKFNNEFIITKEKINEILKVSSFTEDSNKIYFNCKSESIYGELTDKSKPNIDTVDLKISDKFIGDIFTDIPISLDVIRKFTGIKYDNLQVKVNTDTKVILFELLNNDSKLKYVATALVK
jgi:hypothetical protein